MGSHYDIVFWHKTTITTVCLLLHGHELDYDVSVFWM